MNTTEVEIEEDIDQIMGPLIENLMGSVDNDKAIILYNDDVNSFELVIACLVAYCNKGITEAEQISLIVHNKGKCIVKHGSMEELTPICKALTDKGLNAEIQ
jgi:ATP-dependent Clp protease adaptor protein ClpS